MSLFQQCFSHIFVSANQQPGFSITGTLTVNTQSVQKTSKSTVVEIHLNNTKLPGKRLSMAILISEI